MTIRLVAVDLDDCLLGPYGAVPDAPTALLADLEADGVRWCVATGRATGRLAGLRTSLRPTAGWICAHGARSWYGSWSRLAPLGPVEMRALVDVIETDWPDACLGVDRDEVLYRDPDYPMPNRPGRASAVVDRDAMVVSGGDMVRVHAERIGTIGDTIEEMGLPLRVWDVGPDDYAEITVSGATKRTAVSMLAEHLGIDASEVAAIGDGHSDAQLLAWAGRSVTFPWAHPAALGAADMIAEGGFGAALRLALS